MLLFSAMCAVVTAGTLRLLGVPFTWPYALVLAWFTLVSLLLLSWQEKALGPDVRVFIRRFMGGMVLKLLVSLVLLIILVKAVRGVDPKPLSSTFALLYFAYLAFTTARLAGRLRSIQRP
ncbi:MAG: hypothetical protein JNL43_10075 [Flavobacteriales bacterium]|nr:hypothetical protein [Flavobacteriales bacterium]